MGHCPLPCNHAHVVGDQHHGHVETMLEILQQTQDLCLNRDVEGSRRFVSDEELRLSRKRNGDNDALP